MSNVTNTLSAIQGAFASGSKPPSQVKEAKPPTEREIKMQQEQAARTQNTLMKAQMATGGLVNDDVVAQAQERLGAAPTALQLSRETGMSLKDLEAQVPAAIQSEQVKFQIQSQQLMQQQMQLAQDQQQVDMQLQEAQALGLEPDPALLERREQLNQQSMQLQQAGTRLQQDSAANTTALLMKAQQLEEARKAKAKEAQAFIKDASGKAAAQDKPVKMQMKSVSFSTASEDGGEE